MKVDIIEVSGRDESGLKFTKYKVYPSSKYGEYEGTPLFESDDSCDAECWCEDNGHSYTPKCRIVPVPADYLHDLERKCDRIRANMIANANCLGWKFTTNITYRVSAAWKDQPTHYAYIGDSGTCGRFEGVKAEDLKTPEGREAKDEHERLISMSEAIWELGLTLTFDKDGKHTIYGIYPRWVKAEEE